jgi:hypothetical protein
MGPKKAPSKTSAYLKTSFVMKTATIIAKTSCPATTGAAMFMQHYWRPFGHQQAQMRG